MLARRTYSAWLCEVGPPLAWRYPGLPPVHDLSPREIAAYVAWRPPGPADEDDVDE